MTAVHIDGNGEAVCKRVENSWSSFADTDRYIVVSEPCVDSPASKRACIRRWSAKVVKHVQKQEPEASLTTDTHESRWHGA